MPLVLPFQQRLFRATAVALLLMTTVGGIATSEAQIVRGRRGAGIIVNAPGVQVRVGPVFRPGFVPRPAIVTPLPRLGVVRPPRVLLANPTLGGGARVDDPALGAALRRAPLTGGERVPGVASSDEPGLVFPSEEYSSAAADSAESSYPPESLLIRPTRQQLAEMGDAELLNLLIAATGQLHERLARLTTGEGWQRYLKLPDDALPPPSPSGQVRLGMRSLQASLQRYDATAANPKYAKIANLPQFEVAHATLAEVVQRYAQTPQDAATESLRTTPAAETDPAPGEVEAPADEEQSEAVLPVPVPLQPDSAGIGDERSILTR